MQTKNLLESVRRNPKNVRFRKLHTLLTQVGFEQRGGKGSHRVYIKSGIMEIATLQNIEGKAKPYQVRQVLEIIEKYSLMEGDMDE